MPQLLKATKLIQQTGNAHRNHHYCGTILDIKHDGTVFLSVHLVIDADCYVTFLFLPDDGALVEMSCDCGSTAQIVLNKEDGECQVSRTEQSTD